MSEKFQEKYRIHSTRLKNWDYSAKGSYFITICTQNREHYFGEINNDKMQLSEIGKIAHSFWPEMINTYNTLIIDEYIIIPNHIHLILFIDYRSCHTDTTHCRDTPWRVSTKTKSFNNCKGDTPRRVSTSNEKNDRIVNKIKPMENQQIRGFNKKFRFINNKSLQRSCNKIYNQK